MTGTSDAETAWQGPRLAALRKWQKANAHHFPGPSGAFLAGWDAAKHSETGDEFQDSED